jgi:hypothetical protein
VGIINRGKLIAEGQMAELADAGSLESAFIAAVSVPDSIAPRLSWLEGST